MNKKRRVRPPVTISLPSSAEIVDGVMVVSDRQVTDLYKTVKHYQSLKDLRKYKGRSERLEEAITNCIDGKAEVDSLYDEIEQWMDNMSGTNLENTYKYDQLSECLEHLYEIQQLMEQLENYQSVVEFPGMF
jgi:hypothetical protein